MTEEDVERWRDAIGWFDVAAGIAPAVFGFGAYLIVLVELYRVSTPGSYNALVVQIIPVLLVAVAVESPGSMQPKWVVRQAARKVWWVKPARFSVGFLRAMPLVALAAGEGRLLFSAAAGHQRASEAFITATLAVGLAALILAGFRRALLSAAPPSVRRAAQDE